MATKIVTKNSSTASAVPTASDLVQGELAVNVADKRLFTEDNGGSIIELGTNPSTIDINAGSIDGTAIGASSASTGAFTTLTATGAFTSRGIDDNADATAITIDSSENVGVGTSSPAAKLDISGVFQFFDDTTPELRIVDSDDNNYALIGYTDGTMSLSSNHGNEAGGADVMQFLTGGAERMRIDSSGNVGIGTSSPAVPLAISATTGAITTTSSTGTNIVYNAMLNSGGGLYLGLEGNTGGGIFSGSSAYDALFGHTGAYKMHFVTSNTIRATIDASGNVGIGTSSPTDKLHLGTSSGGTQLKIQSGSGINNCILHTNGTTDSWRTGMNLSLTDGSYEFYDDVNNVSRMVIDSSGNLLVGKTATGLANSGVELTASNILRTTKASSASAEFNRTGTDGDIAIFWKDTSPVGSIGTYEGTTVVTGKYTGLKFNYANATNSIIHTVSPSGVVRDAVDDLGYAGSRFKDLYLSGGVYLGGTGGANKLDDYEEGTFTPTLAIGAGSITYSARLGTYTKVGNLVNCTIAISLSAVSSPSGTAYISGLPFTNSLGEGYVSAISVGIARSFASALEIKGYVNNNASTITLGKNPSNAGHNNLTGGDLTSSTVFYISFAYQAA